MVSPSSPERRTSMRSAALSSLFPFLLFFFGHYFSLSFVVSDYLSGEKGYHYYPAAGGSLWVSGDDDFVAQVMAVVFLSYLLLCLSTVATVVSTASSAAVDPSGSRHHSLLESFSKARALWWRLRQPSSSAARLYFAFLFLGYLLSLLAVLVATLAVAGGGDALSLGTWRLLASLLVLFAFLYVGILRWSVGLLPAGADEEGGHEAAAVAKAPWSTALALMEEGKLQGFFLFFFSLLAVHGVLLLSRGGLYWEEQYYFFACRRQVWGGGGFHENAVFWSIWHPSLILPLVVSSVWMLGTCRLFWYLGVLLQVF